MGCRFGMFTKTQLLFVVVSAVIGLVVGVVVGRSPQAAPMQIPAFAWLVLGLLAFELLLGLALRAHPATLVSMPVRLAALVTAVVVCYATLGAFDAK